MTTATQTTTIGQSAYPFKCSPWMTVQETVEGVRAALARGEDFTVGPHFLVRPVGESMRVWRDGDEIACYTAEALVALWHRY